MNFNRSAERRLRALFKTFRISFLSPRNLTKRKKNFPSTGAPRLHHFAPEQTKKNEMREARRAIFQRSPFRF
jgi:hypothetical protein